MSGWQVGKVTQGSFWLGVAGCHLPCNQEGRGWKAGVLDFLELCREACVQVNNVRDFNEEDYMDGDLMDEELVE